MCRRYVPAKKRRCDVPDWIVKYWAEWLFGIISAGLIAGYKKLSKKIKCKTEEDKAIKDGLLAILHDHLYQACNCYLSKGCIDSDSLKNVEYLYNAYHALGGNGTGTVLYQKICNLPIKEG